METKPYGNSKRDTPFQRLLPSTRVKLKNSIYIPRCRPKDFLDEVYRSSGDIINVRNMNELPRRPPDLYNAQHTAKKVTLSDPHLLSNQGRASENSSEQYGCYFRRQRETKALQNHSSL